MNRKLGVAGVLGAALLFTASANAQVWNKRTILTVHQPIEVPGAVLEPGKYVMKLVDSPSNRHIVQFMNDREDRVLSTVLAIPNYRMQPSGDTQLSFYEMPAGQPEALRAWFYPGDNYGQEFVYPKSRAIRIAQVTNTTVPQMADTNDVAAMNDANMADQNTTASSTTTSSTDTEDRAQWVDRDVNEPRTASGPMADESARTTDDSTMLDDSAAMSNETAEAQDQAGQSTTPDQTSATTDQTRTRDRMPRTASDTGLIALMAGLSVAGAMGLRHRRRATVSNQ
jgi:hypothetical protein